MASSRQGIFAQPVRPLDVGVGAALGLALGAVVKYLLNKLNATSGTIPAAILTYGGPIAPKVFQYTGEAAESRPPTRWPPARLGCDPRSAR